MRSPEARRAEAEEYLVAERRTRTAGLKKFRSSSRVNISRLGRSSTFARHPARRRENDLRSRTYSESDLVNGRLQHAVLTVIRRIYWQKRREYQLPASRYD